MKNLTDLQKDFGPRLVTLRTGASGLRGGLTCEVKTVDGGAILDFVATDETLDRYGEVIRLAGWDTKNYLANPVVPDCHNYDSVMRILGRTIDLSIADGRMVNRVEFALDNPLGNIAYKMAKAGFIKSESVGFIPLDWEDGKGGNDQATRIFTKQELLEISLVVVPANPGATLGLALKSGAIERADLRAGADLLKKLSDDKTDPAAPGGTSGAGIHDVRLLELARTLRRALAK